MDRRIRLHQATSQLLVPRTATFSLLRLEVAVIASAGPTEKGEGLARGTGAGGEGVLVDVRIGLLHRA